MQNYNNLEMIIWYKNIQQSQLEKCYEKKKIDCEHKEEKDM